MADIDCTACQQLRDSAPDFSVNGVTDKVCNYLKNNTGLGGQSDNCTDLALANDCLIGQMRKELAAYDTCDWQTFMKKYIGNDHTMNAAENCAICAIDDNLKEIWCWLEHLTTATKSYSIRAYDDEGHAINGFRIADGVEMRRDSELDVPIHITAKGSIANVSGSLRFNGNMPTEYTNGQEVPWNYLQHGCGALTTKDGNTWGANGVCSNTPLIWEIQFKKCQLGFSSIFGRAYLYPGNAGDFLIRIRTFQKGDLVPPDWQSEATHTVEVDGEQQVVPWPDSYTFDPEDDDMILFQLRLQNTRVPLGSPTPGGNIDVIPCPNQWSCDE